MRSDEFGKSIASFAKLSRILDIYAVEINKGNNPITQNSFKINSKILVKIWQTFFDSLNDFCYFKE